MTAITDADLISIHNSIDTDRPETRIDAANLALDRWQPSEKVRSVDAAQVVLMTLYKSLLESNYYGAASLLCWGIQGFDPRPYFVKQVWQMLHTSYKFLIMGCAAGGKCLGKGTKVLMFDGSTKNAEDVIVGDKLMGDDSTPRTVLSLSRGRSRMFRIIPSHGKPWTCNHEHILSLRCSQNKPNGDGKTISSTYTKGRILDVPAKYYQCGSETFRGNYRQFSVAVTFPKKPLQYDPYIYGLWIGDGSAKQAGLHNQDQAIIKTWCQYFESLGYRIQVNRKGGSNCHGYFARTYKRGDILGCLGNNPFSRFAQSSVINGEKRILRDYLINSRRNRLKLLAGIIDTDGWSEKSGFAVATKYAGLAEDIGFLARSLGMAAYSRKTIKRIKSLGFSGTYYSVWINGKSDLMRSIPTLLKKLKHNGNGRDPTNVGITIESLPKDDYFGFAIDGNHRFLLGDFTVTHNSFNVLIFDFHDFQRDPWNTTIKYISTTAGHAKAQAMSTLVRLHRESVIPMAGYIRQGFIGMDKDDLRSSISELAIDKGSEVEGRSGKLQGFHPYPRKHDHPVFGRLTRVRARLEECEDIPDPVWPGVSNVLATAGGGNVSVGGMFNPRKRDSMTARMVEPERGWSWFDIDKSERWRSKKGFDVLRLDGARCENVIEKRIVYHGLIDWAGYSQHSEDSADYYTFSRGAYPVQSVSFSIIPSGILDLCRGTFIWDKTPTPVGALDMAEEGRDKAIFTAGRYGLARAFQPEGRPQRIFPRPRWCCQVDQQFSLPKKNTILMGKDAISLCRQLRIQPDWFGLDSTSSITLGNWMELNWGGVNKIIWGEGATDLLILRDGTEKASDLYENVKTELYFVTGAWLEFGYMAFSPHMDTSKLFSQLSGMHYKPTGKTKKRCHTEKYKKDFGGESPDEASSCVMLSHVIRIHESYEVNQSVDPDKPPDDDDVIHEPDFVESGEEMEQVIWV